MIQRMLTEFSIRHPRLVMVLGVVITLFFLAAFPSLKTDTDPVKMLPQDNPAVTLYSKVKSQFNVNDIVGLGIKSKDGSSLFTKDGLTRIHNITKEILEIKDEPPQKTFMSKVVKTLGFLNKDKKSNDDLEIIVKEDVISISTADDIVRNDAGELLVTPLMSEPPKSDEEAAAILERLNDNPMLAGKMVSHDGSVVGIFIPLVNGKKERSYYLGQKVQQIAEKYLGENEEYHTAGLPIAESTFGNEMFMQMAVYAPAAGLVIFLLLLFFFRSVKVVAAPMMLGVMVVVWSMGALIYSGNVIHIMSSMIPIFLLPIAVLNSIHILSKLNDKMAEFEKREDAIHHVMKELFNPMLYTSITTIVGFVSLSTTGIPPVIVFGVTIGFGVFMSWLLSMIFIPAYTMLLSPKSLANFGVKGRKNSIMVEVVQFFKKIAWSAPKTVIVAAIVLLVISFFGIRQIVVNDNPVRWFKSDHFLRKADVAMNEKLAGTYMANLYFGFPEQAAPIETKAADNNDDNKDNNTTDEFDEFADEEETVNPLTVKDPRVIKYMEGVGNYLKSLKNADGSKLVGDVTSITDVLKKIGSVALDDGSLPDTREKVSQYMFLFESGDIKKGKDLWKVITPGDSEAGQMWVYFKSGDNQNMQRVMDSLKTYVAKNPLPEVELENGRKVPLELKWSGLMHINNVWQGEMVSGMMKALIGSFIIVFFMMVFLFRSVKWAGIAMLPLTITIMFIYGAIGFAGKFYDMPIAVLSSLTLGLSIDFAIHFIEHSRMFNRKLKDCDCTLDEIFNGTSQAIWRNVLVISVGFAPLFFAGLVPYVTVGSFFFAIMMVSGVTTLILLPAILKQFHPTLPGFKEYLAPQPVKSESKKNKKNERLGIDMA